MVASVIALEPNKDQYMGYDNFVNFKTLPVKEPCTRTLFSNLSHGVFYTCHLN
jgi:hypothetical protein